MPLTGDGGATRNLLLELLGIPRMRDDRLRDIATAIDWHDLLHDAGSHLHPMLACRVQQRGLSTPAGIHGILAEARRASAMALAQRRVAMRGVFELLRGEAIPVTVVKGYALAHLVYPAPETRVMSDVDLWLEPADLGRAITALAPLGWQVPWWRRSLLDAAGEADEVAIRWQESAMVIELHRAPRSLADAALPYHDFIARRVAVELGGAAVHTLSREDSLVHLAVHLANHHRFTSAIGRLLDVTLCVARWGADLDWSSFAEHCRRHQVAGWVATTLATARDLLGAPVPPDALAGFGVPNLDELRTVAAQQAFLSDRSGQTPLSVLAEPTLAGRAARIGTRVREVFRPSSSAGGTGGELRRVGIRLRILLQFKLPAFIRAAWRGTWRGESGVQLQRVSADNEMLVRAMETANRAARHGPDAP